MGLTIFLLGLLFVVLGAVMVRYLGALGLVLVAGFLLAQWFFSDKLALYGMGGREVTPEQAPQLHAIVDRLCAIADMPKPRSPSRRPTYPTRSRPGARRTGPSCARPPAS
jgi:heat shock protein HtpX